MTRTKRKNDLDDHVGELPGARVESEVAVAGEPVEMTMTLTKKKKPSARRVGAKVS